MKTSQDSPENAGEKEQKPGSRISLASVFIAASVTFGASLLVVVTSTFPSNFFILVRGQGLAEYSTTIFAGSNVPPLILFLSSIALIAGTGKGIIRAPKKNGFAVAAVALTGITAVGVVISYIAVFVPFLAPSGLSLIAYGISKGTRFFGVSPGKLAGAILVSLLFILTAIEVISAIRWVFNGFDGAKPLSGGSWAASQIDLKLFNLAYFALPRLTLLFLAAWALRLASFSYWSYLRGAVAEFTAGFGATRRKAEPTPSYEGWGGRVLLPASMVAAAFVGVYPYLPAINPASALVGVDTPNFYLSSLNTMMGGSPASAVGYAFANDRSLFLLLPYLLAEGLNSAPLALEMMPPILGVLLVLSTYWFVKTLSGDGLVAGTSALLSAFSFQVTAGIDGGFLANWLAIIEVLVFLGLFLTGLGRKDKRRLYVATPVSVLLLFTHPWTWFVLMGMVVVYFLLTAILARIDRDMRGLRFDGTVAALVVIVNLVANGLKGFLPTGSGIAALTSSRTPSLLTLDPGNFVTVVDTLQSTFQLFLGGALANPVVIVLAIVGALFLAHPRRGFDRILLSWVLVTTAGIMFTGVSAEFLQARVFYLVPFQIFAGVGFVNLVRFLATEMKDSPRGSELAGVFVPLAYVSLFSVFLAYALRTVGFLYPGIA